VEQAGIEALQGTAKQDAINARSDPTCLKSASFRTFFAIPEL